MGWSFKVANVSGIEVRIHVTFFLILVFYWWLYYSVGGLSAASAGLIFVLLLFLCVLLHEFGHAFAARAFGIRTPDITLLPIGGVARLERKPTTPYQELIIAVAGPAVNVVIALLLLPFVLLNSENWDLLAFDRVEGGMAGKLLAMNLLLVGFNMIPAFPMDGGRVLRALLASFVKESRATLIAARVGQVIAVLFGIAGFLCNPMLLIIALFVFSGAQQELAYSRFREGAAQATVSRFLTTRFDTLPAHFPVEDLPEFLADRGQSVFPVVDSWLHVQGLARRSDLMELPKRPFSTLSEAVRQVPVLPANTPAIEALEIMQKHDEPILPVVNPTGQIVGLVSAASLLS